MGSNLLPCGRNGCTKKGIIIKYWNKEIPVIRKAHLEKFKNIKEKCLYIFSPDEKIIGKGIEGLKKVLEQGNEKFLEDEEDFRRLFLWNTNKFLYIKMVKKIKPIDGVLKIYFWKYIPNQEYLEF